MKAVAVQAFACGVCKRLRRSKAKAESCCRCRCGRAVCSRWIDRCESCGKRNAIRRAKAEVRRVEAILQARKDSLACARAA
jgi:hypothetical protein